jgi:D-tagatose-1,6-bisphosphate aldolase subunit GatZ/KbaZ
VEAEMDKLLNNMADVDIPMGLLMQYMPIQYMKVRDGKLGKTARELVKDKVVNIVEDYNYAVKRNYMVGSIYF